MGLVFWNRVYNGAPADFWAATNCPVACLCSLTFVVNIDMPCDRTYGAASVSAVGAHVRPAARQIMMMHMPLITGPLGCLIIAVRAIKNPVQISTSWLIRLHLFYNNVLKTDGI